MTWDDIDKILLVGGMTRDADGSHPGFPVDQSAGD